MSGFRLGCRGNLLPTILAAGIAFFFGAACSEKGPEVVVYTSVDQIYSEPILKDFSARTGITVLPVFDVEAVKTTGLVQRLLSESEHPRADVFWNNEFAQSIYLAEHGVLAPLDIPQPAEIRKAFRDPSEHWIALGCRYRVFLASNTLGVFPDSIEDLPSSLQYLRIGMAHPSFGTTATWAASLRAQWGAEESGTFLMRLSKAGMRVFAGNSIVRDLVVSGALDLGLTDSDDACRALAEGASVRIIFAGQGGGGPLAIPGSIAQIAGAPHPEEARRLMEYLLQPEIGTELIRSGAFQASARINGPRSSCIGDAKILKSSVSLNSIAKALPGSHRQISRIFLR